MKLTILTENVAGSDFLAEHGVSYLIEIDGEKILFDTGHSDVFLRNAKKMGIELHTEVEKVVLSHGHWDHGDGLNFIENKTLIAHPESFLKRFRKTDLKPIGLSLSKTEIRQKFNLIETTEPIKISDHLFFLGEIPRENDFEAKTTTFVDENGNPDFVPDDSALAAIVNQQVIVITGCSHSGICNITEHAQKVTGISNVKVVMGGFHLKKQNRQTLQTVEYFKTKRVERLLPSHCTELPALAAFYESFPFQQIKTGMVFHF